MKISIPQPCHENWNQMLPGEKGRFCLSCQKCVTDFTKLSDKEILEILQKPYQCGRFSQNQLESINRKLEQQNRFQFPKIFRYSTLMIGLGFGGTLVAQEKEKVEIVESKSRNSVQIKSDSIVLKATVVDSDRFPISDASVVLKGYNTETYTDENGYFEVKIPNENPKNIITITDVFGDSQEFCVEEINNKDIIFGYFPEGELMVVGFIRQRTFTRKILHTITWPFRQIGRLF